MSPTVIRKTLDAHLDSLRDAIDPENGIEDEYNPKHDKTYVWRGLRLLACEQLTGMADACGEPFDVIMIKEKKIVAPKPAVEASAGGMVSCGMIVPLLHAISLWLCLNSRCGWD